MIIYNPNSCLYLIISNHSDYDLTIIRIIHQNLPIHPIDSIDPISWVCGNVVIVSQQAAIKGTPDDSSPSGGHGMGWRPTWRHRRRWAQRPRRNLLQVGLLGEFEVQHAPKLDITGCLWNSVNHFESFWMSSTEWFVNFWVQPLCSKQRSGVQKPRVLSLYTAWLRTGFPMISWIVILPNILVSIC